MADSRTHIYANDARSTLASGIASGATSLQLVDHFDDFPSPGVDEIFKVTLQDTATGVYEICNCTARSSGLLTIERGQEGTDAVDWAAGVLVAHRNTAETMEHLEESAGGGGGSPKIAYAIINQDGSLEPGAVGVASCVNEFGGQYTVTFEADYFSAAPVINAMIDFANSGGGEPRTIVLGGVEAHEPTGARLYVYNLAGSLVGTARIMLTAVGVG